LTELAEKKLTKLSCLAISEPCEQQAVPPTQYVVFAATSEAEEVPTTQLPISLSAEEVPTIQLPVASAESEEVSTMQLPVAYGTCSSSAYCRVDINYMSDFSSVSIL
jgi:hypothetical protein